MSKYERWKGIMKCYPFSTDRLDKWKPPYIVQPKLDGVRCRALALQTGLQSNEYLLLSSEENIIYSVPHINQALSKLRLDCELDGELYCHGLKFEEIISITSRTINFHLETERIQFHLFDIVNDQPQMKRQLIIENLRGLSPWIVVVSFYLCESLDDVLRAYDKIINQGYEGIIVRNVSAPYVRKRSTQVMKFKPKKEDEYEIIGTQEEFSIDGRAKDSLGALVCNSGDGHQFNVGTGFSADQRKSLWKDKELLLGKVAKVKYQHITSGNKVPRFPVFVEIV